MAPIPTSRFDWTGIDRFRYRVTCFAPVAVVAGGYLLGQLVRLFAWWRIHPAFIGVPLGLVAGLSALAMFIPAVAAPPPPPDKFARAVSGDPDIRLHRGAGLKIRPNHAQWALTAAQIGQLVIAVLLFVSVPMANTVAATTLCGVFTGVGLLLAMRLWIAKAHAPALGGMVYYGLVVTTLTVGGA